MRFNIHCYDGTIFENLQTNLNIEKITFKVVQIKFLSMQISYKKLSFDIFTVKCTMILIS